MKDNWTLADFENDQYHLAVYGPNGFFREFKGNSNNSEVEIVCDYEHAKMKAKRLTGNISLRLKNKSGKQHVVEITDNAYKASLQTKLLPAADTESILLIDLGKSHHWYDFTVKIKRL